jgi:HEPN domain
VDDAKRYGLMLASRFGLPTCRQSFQGEQMTRVEFEARMNEIDCRLSDDEVHVPLRPILAWFAMSNAKTLEFSERDPHSDPFAGPNLQHSIQDWYVARFPAQATIQPHWGPRLVLIRNVPFRAKIPVYFNPAGPLDAFKYIEDLEPALRASLDAAEAVRIQDKYNRCFDQASLIALNWTTYCCPMAHGLVSHLVHKGWEDLRVSCKGFLPEDPSATLFTCQQAAEKYLKAMILVKNPSLTDNDLRTRYNHGVAKLLEECARIDPGLSPLMADVSLLAFKPSVRYQRDKLSPRAVVQTADFAHDVCHAVARHLLNAEAARPREY